MRPISPQNYKGIVYIQLNTLPNDQYDQISNWLPAIELIKLRIGDHTIEKCLKYDDYLFWYKNFFYTEETTKSEI